MIDPERMLRDSPMLRMVLPIWNAVALHCAWFELQVRLAAGVTDPAASVNKNIGGEHGLLTVLFEGGGYEEGDQQLLRSCAVIRNKLLHCEPDALLRELRKLDPTFEPPRAVTQVNLGNAASGAEIRDALATQEGAVSVQDTVSREAGFFGWMMEAAATGVFARAVEVLARGIEVLASRPEPHAAESGAGRDRDLSR